MSSCIRGACSKVGKLHFLVTGKKNSMDMFRLLLYVIVLYGACTAGLFRIRAQSGLTRHSTKLTQLMRQLPWATLLLIVAIGIPTTLQFFFPSILMLFRRDASAFLAGDWWRVLTPLFVQDGGVSGSIFNLLSLLFVGSVAEHLWGRVRWLIIFFLGGISSEIISLAWQPVGAGNSLANFSLAASVAAICFTRDPLPLERVAACLALGAGAWLLALHDNHGAAVAVGAVIALMLIWFDNRRPQRASSTPELVNSL
ncbi:MAG TPA: rhomboid family intramembrane serine protease [Pirellulales bacterium]